MSLLPLLENRYNGSLVTQICPSQSNKEMVFRQIEKGNGKYHMWPRPKFQEPLKWLPQRHPL